MWKWVERFRSGEAPAQHPAAERKRDRTGEEISDEELLERVAERIVRMRMTVPAILFLESSRPLSFVGSQFLIFMEPFVKTFFTARSYDRFAELMEDRTQYESLIRTIERLEAEGSERARAREKVETDDR